MPVRLSVMTTMQNCEPGTAAWTGTDRGSDVNGRSGVRHTQDRPGRPKAIADAVGSREFAYNTGR